MIDIGAELVSALLSPDGRRAVADAVRVVVAEELKRALDERDADQLLDTKALARLLGAPSARAVRARLSRGSELAAIAFVVDGRKMWRRSEVMRVLEEKAR